MVAIQAYDYTRLRLNKTRLQLCKPTRTYAYMFKHLRLYTPTSLKRLRAHTPTPIYAFDSKRLGFTRLRLHTPIGVHAYAYLRHDS